MAGDPSYRTALENAFIVAGVKNRFHLYAMDHHDVSKALTRILNTAPSCASAFVRQLAGNKAKLENWLPTLLENSWVQESPQIMTQLLGVSVQVGETQDHERRWQTALDATIDVFLDSATERSDRVWPVLKVLMDDKPIGWSNSHTDAGLIMKVVYCMDAMEEVWVQEDDVDEDKLHQAILRGTRILEHLAQQGVAPTHQDLMATCLLHDKEGTASAALHALLNAGCPIDGLDPNGLGQNSRLTLDHNPRWRAHLLGQISSQQKNATPEQVGKHPKM